MPISKREIARYIFLPGIMPRMKELALDLHWLASLMAVIFAATRILPNDHPYVRRNARQRFGIQDVLFEAGRNLKGGVRHIDQYIVYASFLLAILLILSQFAVLIVFLAVHTADAATNFNVPSFSGMFVTRVPDEDLAMMMLDKVFEIPNMFNSKFDPARVGITLFGAGLHGIFAFYNEGMLFIGGLIFVYYIFAVVLETVQTGTPFGQRFQEVFVPIRLILALAFLVPLGYGFSAGQMLVFKLAQWGSGFATNGWIIFNQRAQKNPLGAGAMELAAMPKNEDIASLIRFYSLVHSCRAIYMQDYSKPIKPYVIYKNGTQDVSASATGLSYDTVAGYFSKGPVTVTFGEKNDAFTQSPGRVKAYCGSITLPVKSTGFDGADLIQAAYWSFLQQLWSDTNLTAYGDRRARNFTHKTDAPSANLTVGGWTNPDADPEAGFYADVRTDLQPRFEAAMEQAKNQIRNSNDAKLEIDDDVMKRGWGGAGIWFNKIAEYNGAIMSASHSLPVPSAYPAVMRKLAARKQETQNGIGILTQFQSTLAGGSLRDAMSGGSLDDPAIDGQMATFLGDVYNDMSVDNVYGDGSETHDNNVVANAFNMIFGTEGLSELRGNEQIHPLAKMSALGKSIIDRATTYIGGAMLMGGLSGIAPLLNKIPALAGVGSGLAETFSGIGSMFISFAFIGLIVGILLYYVIPLIPFLYFFFAVGRWVKSIFEAVVAIPLWALAHLRIDGEGIPGEAAAQGYILLLEILLRPILIVFGLLAAVSTFSALAIVLDTIFDVVLSNVTGHNPMDAAGNMNLGGLELKRSSIDQFFYTIVYAVLLYLMAMSCFKLIDLIPAGVLRFIGTGVSSFNDEMNLESNLVRYTTVGTYGIGRQAGQAAMQLGRIAGDTVAAPINIMSQFMPDTTPPTQQPAAPQPGNTPNVANAAAATEPPARPAAETPATEPPATQPATPERPAQPAAEPQEQQLARQQQEQQQRQQTQDDTSRASEDARRAADEARQAAEDAARNTPKPDGTT